MSLPATRKREVKVLILEMLRLSPISNLENKIFKEAATNEPGSASNMADVISGNRTLSGNVLKVANAACFGAARQVSTIPRAIVVLGFEAVKGIALSASVIEAFRNSEVHDHFDWSGFWTHSLACAYLSKKIAGMIHLAQLETAFVCGLLHDFGKIILDTYFPRSYRFVLRRSSTGGLTMLQAEEEMLGFNHAEVGMWAAQQWGFQKAIVFTIANHHRTIAEDTRYEPLAGIVRLANHLCFRERLCLAEQAVTEPLDDSTIRCLKLEQNDLNELQHSLARRKESFDFYLPGQD
jgi:putative nucleotidyltransferase with HDIG domain